LSRRQATAAHECYTKGMRVVVLYHPNSDHSGFVEDFAHEYERFKGKELELVSLETRDGAAAASLYDVTTYPAILVTADDGSLQKMWQGIPMPIMSELDQYTQDTVATPELVGV